MKGYLALLLVALPFAGCAQLGMGTIDPRERTGLWADAQAALAAEEFSRAEAIFSRLATEYGESVEGRESLFYLGAIRLDPRNAAWDSGPAEEWLARYLSHIDSGGPRLYRYPEARSMHELARQLNLPAESRVAGLQPEERVVRVEERVVVPAQQSRAQVEEIQSLRQQVAERDARIQQQQEELERIRRTLTAPAPR